MATIADLKKVRQELINKTPLLYQGEVFDKWDYVNGETKLNPPNTPSDFKLVLIKEAINIWDNKTYNLSNLTKIFKPNSDLGNWEVVLKGWLSVKNTLKLDDWSQKGYLERRRAVPEIYEDWNNEITQLTTDKATAETNLKKYTDTLGTSTPAELKDKLTTLDQAKTKAEGERDSRPNINLADYQKLQDNQEKHTDYDTIKKERDNWVVVFPSPLTPDLVKVEYDKPKETHSPTDLKPTDYEQIKADLATAQTNLKTANEKIATLESDKISLNNQLTSKDTTISDLQSTIKNKDEIIDGNKGLDQKLNDLNKQLSDKDIELGKRTDTITSLTTEKTQAQEELNKYNALFPVFQIGEPTSAETLKQWLVKNKQEISELLVYWNKNLKEHGDLDIEGLKDLAVVLKRAKRYLDKWDELNAYWTSDFKDDFMYAPITLDALKLVRGRLNEYLNKILTEYKKQITEQTKNFYLENLKLDESDDIRPKYKDKITEIGKNPESDDYTVLLDDLNRDSKPQEVINAFKLLALVCATEKAVKEGGEWVKTNAFKNKVLKENKLKYFVNIKNHWDRLKDLKLKEENNPLYLTKELDEINRDFWREQLDETIEVWKK